MKRIVITGIRGGVGATTVAANITAAFHSIDQQAHIIDMKADNLMRLHFCMDPMNTDGWMVRRLNGEAWTQAGYQTNRQIPFVPFGQVTKKQSFQLTNELREAPNGLAEAFEITNATPEWNKHWQIILLPELPALEVYHYPLIQQADLVICVTRTDIQSYLSIQQSSHYQHLLKMSQPKLLINQFQPTSSISRDLQLVMEHEYENNLVPIVLHSDTAIAEAIANLKSVLESAPYSQAAQDYHSLAFWCLSHLNQSSLETNHV